MTFQRYRDYPRAYRNLRVWIGYHIRLARSRAGMTQRDLARAAKVSEAAVSRWERGQRLPYFDLLCRVAKALGVDAWDLIEGEK